MGTTIEGRITLEPLEDVWDVHLTSYAEGSETTYGADSIRQGLDRAKGWFGVDRAADLPPAYVLKRIYPQDYFDE